MPFPQDPKTFTLYNYGTGTATISSLVFVTANGTQHRADLSGFGASTTYTNPTLTGLAVSLAPAASIPFTLDYTNSTGDLTSYRNILTVNGTVNGFSDQASLDAVVVVSSAPVVDGGGGGGGDGAAAAPCADNTSQCSASGGGECFTAGTLITMYDGTSKPIDNIVIDDLVLDALTGKPNKVIGIKATEYEVGRRIFATQKGVTPFITEQHAFYNDQNELCAISEECEYLAPWLGSVKIVNVPEITTNDRVQTVYNLMFETGNSHYANGVKVSNIVGTGNTYVLFMKGYLDKESYLGYIYHLENTVGLNALTQEQKAVIFNIVSWMSSYVLRNNNLRSYLLAKCMSWAIRNRTTLYPYLEKWFKSRLRSFIVGKKK